MGILIIPTFLEQMPAELSISRQNFYDKPKWYHKIHRKKCHDHISLLVFIKNNLKIKTMMLFF